jgi:hypothetical protein
MTTAATKSCCAGDRASSIETNTLHQYPSQVFRYVPAHELGHYVGLCHWTHDGFQNIMFTPESSENLHWVWSLGMLWFLVRSEPEFSLADGKNAWRFFVSEMPSCLEPHI